MTTYTDTHTWTPEDYMLAMMAEEHCWTQEEQEQRDAAEEGSPA